MITTGMLALLVLLQQTTAPAAEPVRLSILSTLPAPACEALRQSFVAAHPGIEVSFTLENDDGVLRAMRNHPSDFDLLLGPSILALDRLAAERLLQPYRPSDERAVGPDFRDRADLWYAYFLEAAAIAYHTNAFDRPLFGKPRTLPSDYADLGEKRFEGEIAIGAPTLSSLSGYTFLSLIEATRETTRDEAAGLKLLGNIDANLMPAAEGASEYSSTAHDALAAVLEGEHPAVLALCSMAEVARAMAEGAPVSYVVPSGGFLVLPRGLALGRDAKAAARQLYEQVTDRATLDLLARQSGLVPIVEVPAVQSIPWMRDVWSHVHVTNHQAILSEAARWMGTFQNDIRGSVHRRFALFDQTFEWLFMVLLVVGGVVAGIKLSRAERSTEIRP